MFLVVAAAVVVLMHLYLWKRLVSDTTRGARLRRVGAVAVAALAVLVAVTLTMSRVVAPDVARWFAWPGYLWFGVLFYLVVALLVLEVPRLALRKAVATDESRRLFLARSAAVVAGVAATGVAGTGVVSALGPPQLRRVAVPIRRLDSAFSGFRIAVVSDIHLGPLLGRGHTERIVRMINEQDVDMVAMVGDLADGTVAELGRAAEPLRDLVSREGTFFVTGNHEYYSGHQQWVSELERLGLTYLRNDRGTLTRGGGSLDVAGVTDVTGEAFEDSPDLAGALAGRDGSAPVVLLAHQPVQVDTAAAAGVDLQLSGHTHGGQLYPFHHIVALAQPGVSGLSKVDDTWLYVTNGAGFWGPPVRVGAPPDISVIELTP